VYSEINLLEVVIYKPTLTPGWSETFVGSSTNTLSSTRASTSKNLSGFITKNLVDLVLLNTEYLVSIKHLKYLKHFFQEEITLNMVLHH
jgi:hypothetical protein